MNRQKLLGGLSLAVLGWAVLAMPAQAQDTADDPQEPVGVSSDEDVKFLDQVVVTGVFGGRVNRLESSVSTSALDEDAIFRTAARSSTEILRSIPGFRVESSGGDNNANIQARGTPLTEGGAKFVQLQEDGLPILQFGDIIFGNADNFLRADFSTRTVEAIRGGSGSIAASNAPAGVVNYISKTGETQGGAVGIVRGLNFDTTRVDFSYGSPVGDNWNFHIGGFFRTGEGPRQVGATGERGFQVRGNVTRHFDDDNGFIRFNFKHLDDRVTAFLPQPFLVTGTDLDPSVSPLPGFDAGEQALSTTNFLANPRFDGNDGKFETTDVSDGSRALTTTFGFELEREIGFGITINNKFRFSDVSSQFTGILTTAVFDATTAAGAFFDGQGVDLAIGGEVLSTDELATLNGNGLISENLIFDTENDDLSNIQNDFRASKSFDFAEFGYLDVTAGYYKNVQQIEQDYFFNTLLLEVQGDDAETVDVLDAEGNVLTTDGFTAFGTFDPTFDLEFDRDALFANFSYQLQNLTVDGGFRYERIDASGTSTQGGGPAAQVAVPLDINGDQVIDLAEEMVNVPLTTALNPINFVADYFSFSIGANYLLRDNLSFFARYSEGASANADRLVIGAFGGSAFVNPDGTLADEDVAVDDVNQVEAGFKWDAEEIPIPGNLNLAGTFFFAETEENTGSAGGTGDFIFSLANEFRALGFEFESQYTSDYVDLAASFTFTDLDITDSDDPLQIGDTPQRQADFTYQVTPTFKLGNVIGRNPYDLTTGLSIIGTTGSFTEAPNGLIQPGFVQVNFFADYFITDQIRLGFAINNITDSFGITEVEEDVLADGLFVEELGGTVVRGRPINGRTATVSLIYNF